MAWVHLMIAGALEVVWAIGLKYSAGFTKPAASAITVAAMLASFVFLSLSLRTIPVGTAYAIWTGIGAAGTAVLGMVLFHESTAVARLLCIVLIVAGIVGLRITAGTPA